MESFLNPDPKSWDDVKRAGVLPGIRNVADYDRVYSSNLPAVVALLRRAPAFITHPDDIREFHRTQFQGITPWAGSFSSTQMTVGGRVGAPPLRAEREFMLLGEQLRAMLPYVQKSTDPVQKIRLAAFMHARFECIHAFLDGNGRIGRLLTEHALTLITRRQIRCKIAKRAYIDALKEASDHHNLSPLTDVFSQAYLGRRETVPFLPSPFRIPAFMEDRLDPFELELQRSIRDDPKLIAVTAVPVIRCWLRDARWERLAQLANGRPAQGHDSARQRMENARNEPMSLGAAIKFISELKGETPFRGRHIFTKPHESAWSAFVHQLLDPLTSQLPAQDRLSLSMVINAQLRGEDRLSEIDDLAGAFQAQPDFRLWVTVDSERPKARSGVHTNPEVGPSSRNSMKM